MNLLRTEHESKTKSEGTWTATVSWRTR